MDRYNGSHAVQPPTPAAFDNKLSDTQTSIPPPKPPPPQWPPPRLIMTPLVPLLAAINSTVLCNILPTYLRRYIKDLINTRDLQSVTS